MIEAQHASVKQDIEKSLHVNYAAEVVGHSDGLRLITPATLANTLCANIDEMAEKGDWIAGTGGSDLRKSAGHGKLIYAMRIDEKISLAEYCRA
jgi:hypothetical protein